jgi:hypothetical protein
MATKSRWSQRVTETSDALTLDEGVFTRTPDQIARSLKRSAERSKRRKSSPYRSAMSMLTFYENRAGHTLSAARRRKLEAAKGQLRELYGRSKPTKKRPPKKAQGAPGKAKRKTPRRKSGARASK